jgi:hypothetical protein
MLKYYKNVAKLKAAEQWGLPNQTSEQLKLEMRNG